MPVQIHEIDNFFCISYVCFSNNKFCSRPPTGLSSYRDERKENGTGDENEKSHNYDCGNGDFRDLTG